LKSILTAAAFSVFYVCMYPLLVGGFVIHAYPYWPPPLAATYVLSGILLQAWFCFGRKRPEGGPLALWPQVVTGIAYAAVGVFFGGAYMS
jgi:hypothetical protein